MTTERMDKQVKTNVSELNVWLKAFRAASDTLAQELKPETIESIRRLTGSLRNATAAHGGESLGQAIDAVEQADPSQMSSLLQRLVDELQATILGTATDDRCVLIVDQDAQTARLLEQALPALEGCITAVLDAATAIQVLQRKSYSLIVLNLNLADMDGRNLLMKIRANPQSASVPVFIVADTVDPLARAECLALGAQEYIEKPLDVGAIAILIEDYVRQSQAIEPVAAVVLSSESPKQTILLAEDDTVTAKIIQRRLQSEGFEVIYGQNGEDALEAASGRDLSLCLLDVQMPVMDGFELLSRLRQDHRFAHVPIVMLTSMGRDQDIQRGKELGATDYMIKPFSPAVLVERVRCLLKQERKSA